MYLSPSETAQHLYDAIKRDNKTIAAAVALAQSPSGSVSGFALNQKAAFLFKKEAVYHAIRKLARKGILKYGAQLCLVEAGTIGSIFMLKLIIDFLKSPSEYDFQYSVAIFVAFTLFRLLAIIARSSYDLHVYNYFKFCETQILCWLFELTCDLRQWQVKEEKRAQLVNILTKDIEIFVAGSWQFPYLITVPLNTLISAMFLVYMFGAQVLLCYVCMGFLLALQYFSNKALASLQLQTFAQSDARI